MGNKLTDLSEKQKRIVDGITAINWSFSDKRKLLIVDHERYADITNNMSVKIGYTREKINRKGEAVERSHYLDYDYTNGRPKDIVIVENKRRKTMFSLDSDGGIVRLTKNNFDPHIGHKVAQLMMAAKRNIQRGLGLKR